MLGSSVTEPTLHPSCPLPLLLPACYQEPDTSACAAQALIGLITAHEPYFPLGFAYGHIRDAAVRGRAPRRPGSPQLAPAPPCPPLNHNSLPTLSTHTLPPSQVSVADLAGRGFANQEILEELAARDELSNKVVARITRGEHHTATPNTRLM